LYSIVFHRHSAGENGGSLSRLEALLQEHKGVAASRLNFLEQTFEKRMSLMQQRLDSFIEYISTIAFDRLACERVENDGGDSITRMPNEVQKFVDTLTKAINSGSVGLPATLEEDFEAIKIIEVSSDAFGDGWYGPELIDGIQCRWMSERGLVFLPMAPSAPCKIEILLCAIYGASEPHVIANIDGRSVPVAVETTSLQGVTLTIVPDRGGQTKIDFLCLSLESLTYNSPLLDGVGEDVRTLSIMVKAIILHYDSAFRSSANPLTLT
jgi:hypothetical protein